METYGATVHASPTDLTQAGRNQNLADPAGAKVVAGYGGIRRTCSPAEVESRIVGKSRPGASRSVCLNRLRLRESRT